MKNPQTIVLTGGGSGGHIIPLLSLAHAIKKKQPNCQIVYIGLKGETLAQYLQERFSVFDEVNYVPAGKFRRYHGQTLLQHILDWRTLVLNLRDIFKVIAGLVSAWRLLGRYRPAIVFSKGGFVAVPVGLAAHIRNIPLITHDSDSVPGLANKVIGRYAKIHAVGTPAQDYPYPKDTVRFTGIPIDERIKPLSNQNKSEYKKELGINPSARVLLIGGAGHGARDLNSMVIEMVPTLLEHYQDLNIIHITGTKHLAEVQTSYKQLSQNFVGRVIAIDFTPEFYKYSAVADLVITRAGATTIAELALQHKATVLVPAPQLSGGHQIKNAQLLKNHLAVEVVDNNNTKELLDITTQILNSDARRQALEAKIGELAKPDAADTLAELLLDQVSYAS